MNTVNILIQDKRLLMNQNTMALSKSKVNAHQIEFLV
jgi:hypothetical protein